MKDRRYSIGSKKVGIGFGLPSLQRPHLFRQLSTKPNPKNLLTSTPATIENSTNKSVKSTTLSNPAAPTISAISAKQTEESIKKKEKKENNEEINKLIKTVSTHDKIFDLLSLAFNPLDILRFNKYTDKLVSQTLTTITPDENSKLTFWGKIKRFFVDKIYKKRIDRFVNSLTQEGIVSFLNGNMNKYLPNYLLFNKPIPAEAAEISGFTDNAKLAFLNTILGKSLVTKVKTYIKGLTPTQLILLSEKDINFQQVIFDSLKRVGYPSPLTSHKEVKDVIDRGLDPSIVSQ